MKGLKQMTDIEKLNIILNDKRVQTRSKLFFVLLDEGLSMQEIIDFPASRIPELKAIDNAEQFFMQYVRNAGVMEKITHSGLLFPGTDGKPMKIPSVLRFLRRSCSINGLRLHQLCIDGLVEKPSRPDYCETVESIDKMTFDEIANILNKRK